VGETDLRYIVILPTATTVVESGGTLDPWPDVYMASESANMMIFPPSLVHTPSRLGTSAITPSLPASIFGQELFLGRRLSNLKLEFDANTEVDRSLRCLVIVFSSSLNFRQCRFLPATLPLEAWDSSHQPHILW
jgi:hypothetical protein